MKYTKEQCLEKGKQIGLTNIEQWPKCVDIRFSDIYEGLDCANFLDLAEKQLALNYSIDELKKELEKQNHSGTSYGMVKSMAKTFCPSLLQIFD